MLGIHKRDERSIGRLLSITRLHTGFRFMVLQQLFKTVNIIKTPKALLPLAGLQMPEMHVG